MQVASVVPPPETPGPKRPSREGEDEANDVLESPRDASRVSTAARGKPAKHKVRHRKQKQGQTIFKGHPSWAIMNNIKARSASKRAPPRPPLIFFGAPT